MGKTENSVDGESINILLIEDNPGDVRLVREMLAEKVGRLFDVQSVERLATGLAHLDAGGIDAVLLDLSLSDSQGLDTSAKYAHTRHEVPIVVLTGS
ncbi:MAG: response regulator [Acidiferrobacterales bacterium]|jgi:DNA-binding response OmpR family regulator